MDSLWPWRSAQVFSKRPAPDSARLLGAVPQAPTRYHECCLLGPLHPSHLSHSSHAESTNFDAHEHNGLRCSDRARLWRHNWLPSRPYSRGCEPSPAASISISYNQTRHHEAKNSNPFVQIASLRNGLIRFGLITWVWLSS